MCHARSAWWLETKSYARRIAPPPPRFTRQPRKKKHSLHFWFGGGGFFLEKERVFFFRGSALKVFGQCGGAKCETRTVREEGFEGRNPAPSSLKNWRSADS